jgi:hypothetical protein
MIGVQAAVLMGVFLHRAQLISENHRKMLADLEAKKNAEVDQK